jgi:hypothetical protein
MPDRRGDPTVYVVFCDQCYSFHREHRTKKAANLEATSHMNVYGHTVHILTPDRSRP